ncbi:MBL fold metallo-hydrolase [Granulicella sp. S156]|uniref:MBL fold metallo-hydrolase n=1 Tax=Granulicella sp. S156 TaxID=1747224 RepID=UPI00131ABF8D|nr:MBL fold metallo-hydrolase [Granulicella sp. S156]
MLKLIALTLLSSTAVVAQQAPAPTPPDYSKVSIVTTKISDHLYALDGAGGRIGVLVGPDGILLVDSEFAPLTDKIMAAVHAISNEPIRYLVNTHVHGDHTGGNENLGKLGVLIFSRDELRHRLNHPSPAANGTPGVPAPAAALPVVTYEGPVTFHLGTDEAHLIPVLHAHTDGDTIVRFSPADAVQAGDIFRSVGYPNIDRINGGSLRGLLDGLGQIIALAGPDTKILPGHGPITDRAAVIAQRDLVLAVRNRVADLIKQGKTQQEILDAHVTSEFDAKVGQPATGGDRFVGQVYAELTAAR